MRVANYHTFLKFNHLWLQMGRFEVIIQHGFYGFGFVFVRSLWLRLVLQKFDKKYKRKKKKIKVKWKKKYKKTGKLDFNLINYFYMSL